MFQPSSKTFSGIAIKLSSASTANTFTKHISWKDCCVVGNFCVCCDVVREARTTATVTVTIPIMDQYCFYRSPHSTGQDYSSGIEQVAAQTGMSSSRNMGSGNRCQSDPHFIIGA